MVLQSWIINCVKMYKISHEVIGFIKKTMKTRRVELTAGGRSLAEAKIQRGFFQGDAISAVLFIITMLPLKHIFRKSTAIYKLWRSQEKMNHLMYMDEIKLSVKNEKELKTLLHAVRIYSQYVGMEFGIEKCALLVKKSGKRHMSDEMELPNQRSEKGNIQILGHRGDWFHQTSGDERKIKKEYLRRTRKLLEIKLSSRNFIKGINIWAVPFVSYSGPFVKWTREEVKQIIQRTRKRIAVHKVLHPRDEVDRLYVSRKEWGRGLASIEDSVDASIQRLVDYKKYTKGDWLQPSEALQTTRWTTEWRWLGNKNERKEISMGVLNDSSTTSHTGKPGHGWEKETFKDKQNFS